MTGAAQLLEELVRRGIEVHLEGNDIRIRPKSAVTPDLRARLVAHKGEAVAILRERPELGAHHAPPPVAEQRVVDSVQPRAVQRASAAPEAIPIAVIFPALGGTNRPATTSCNMCGGSRWWRLRDAGRGEPGEPRCCHCHPGHPGDDRVVFLVTDGGAA